MLTINGIDLFYKLSGTGRLPLILVHGSWASHQDWEPILPYLIDDFRILTYDRRGHSQSQRLPEQGSVHEDVTDLAALIEQLGLAPAWVVGNSFGGSITLRLAAERPELFRGLIAHEPPLFALLVNDPKYASMMNEIKRTIEAVAQRIASGDHRGAAEQFVDLALGPGMWAELPPEVQQSLIENALTFLDEVRDPSQLAFDLGWIRAFPQPVLLTAGKKSPPIFAPVLEKLSAVLPPAVVLVDVGHIPHVTQPESYAETITSFVQRNSRN
jgi:pimeloyl-ACP methyl ester carboxylesterase